VVDWVGWGSWVASWDNWVLWGSWGGLLSGWVGGWDNWVRGYAGDGALGWAVGNFCLLASVLYNPNSFTYQLGHSW